MVELQKYITRPVICKQKMNDYRAMKPYIAIADSAKEKAMKVFNKNNKSPKFLKVGLNKLSFNFFGRPL